MPILRKNERFGASASSGKAFNQDQDLSRVSPQTSINQNTGFNRFRIIGVGFIPRTNASPKQTIPRF
ncbi:MAG: hypothetical protein CVU48_09455 [Candidatus Cloacimonetes bacterium HGW-Cloacimonetes-1]|jgi:hypothetical protein|nr:MAG: hypothetical protein CVU48_09455 [Candidatus Cloacimonetes bacterium HGW-Cloacimonetes-1]